MNKKIALLYIIATLFICPQAKAAIVPVGSVLVVSSNNLISQPSDSNLYWDWQNSRLGIGTNVPSYKLQVNGSLSAYSVTASGTVSANLFVGSGAGLTNISAVSLPTSFVTNNYYGAVSINSGLYVSSGITANSFSGDGAAITNISQSSLPSTSVSNNYGSSVSINGNLYISGVSAFGGAITGTITTANFSTSSVAKSSYDANTILKADSDDTPVALTIPNSTFVGRTSSSNIVALTVSQAKVELGAGNADGLATLDSGGKIPAAQLPSSVMEYQGVWNASSNIPTLIDGVGNTGDVYLVNVAGTQNLGSGTQNFQVGDWAVYNGLIWQKTQNTDAVTSVFSRTGAVVAANGDYTASQITNVANGDISSTTVQSAINELDTEKQPTSAVLSGLSIVSISTANKLIYSTASNTFTTTDFTDLGRSLVDDADAGAARTTIELDSASNVSFAGVTVSGTVSANLFVGSGAELTNIPISSLSASVVTDNYSSDVSLNSNLYVGSQLSAVSITVNGTVSANNFLGGSFVGSAATINGPLSAQSSVINGAVTANSIYISGVSTFSDTMSAAAINVSGTVSANTFTGDGFLLTNLPTVNYALSASSANYSLAASTANFASTATTANYISSYPTDIVTSNYLAGGVSINGTVSANFFVGNGSLLTSINATVSSNVVTTNYGTPITLTGLLTASSITVNGTVSANTLIVNSSIGTLEVSANAYFKNVTANRVDAGTFNTISIDYAEWFDAEEAMSAGDVVGLNSETLLVRKARNGDIVMGVISTTPGVTGGVPGENKVLVALMGQVPVNTEQVVIRGARVFANGKLLGILLNSGNILLRINP